MKMAESGDSKGGDSKGGDSPGGDEESLLQRIKVKC